MSVLICFISNHICLDLFQDIDSHLPTALDCHYSFKQVVTNLLMTYRNQITRKAWLAVKHHKEKVEAQGLQAEVTQLKRQLRDLNK